MSRARRVLCRACLALAAVLAVLLLLPLPLPPPLPRAPALDPGRVPTRSLTLEVSRLQPDDVFIAVKTTRKNHGPRLRLLLRTWISRAPRQVRAPSLATKGPGFRARVPDPGAPHLVPDPLIGSSGVSRCFLPQTFIFTDGDDPELQLLAGKTPLWTERYLPGPFIPVSGT